eukprot:TRINITY_DN15664_c0_g1_i1.p1 TRINITY_DN15664_c0_g1~~TRINITY_DN15664_c0_g1_i1.p1  ORF type:complete len:111 (+),score=22.26 TRINITY_DN15664_c0_g1_i1:43-375(+)
MTLRNGITKRDRPLIIIAFTTEEGGESTDGGCFVLIVRTLDVCINTCRNEGGSWVGFYSNASTVLNTSDVPFQQQVDDGCLFEGSERCNRSISVDIDRDVMSISVDGSSE